MSSIFLLPHSGSQFNTSSLLLAGLLSRILEEKAKKARLEERAQVLMLRKTSAGEHASCCVSSSTLTAACACACRNVQSCAHGWIWTDTKQTLKQMSPWPGLRARRTCRLTHRMARMPL